VLPEIPREIQLFVQTKLNNQNTLSPNIIVRELDVPELNKKEKLRLVVCSDTHGMEHQLDEFGPGDILVHCGDFAVDANAKIRHNSLLAFDAWLGSQDFACKLVCRGNHDPFRANLRNAEYVTRITLFDINNSTFRVLVLPHGTYSTDLSTLVASPPDIVISHHPPRGILDTTYQNKRAGSIPLRIALETNRALNSSRLWLLGHIHEAAGATFVEDTLFINAANANPGRATRIVRSHVSLDIDTTISSVNNDNKLIHPSTSNHPSKISSIPGILLALDLGLNNIGAAAFCLDTDQLLAYAAGNDVVHAVRSLGLEKTNITLVTEGCDRALRDDAVNQLIESGLLPRQSSDAQLVAANHWRKHLLLPRERTNKQQAKHAARLIARQLIHNNNLNHSFSKPTTDAAEAICFGAWAIRELRLSSSSTRLKLPPIVSRYTNGNIALPPHSISS